VLLHNILTTLPINVDLNGSTFREGGGDGVDDVVADTLHVDHASHNAIRGS
jgi:hypothetical protein